MSPVPDDLEASFNRTFEGEDKDAILARLMRQAVEERERSRRSGNFVERMRRIRARGLPVADDEIKRARQELRDS